MLKCGRCKYLRQRTKNRFGLSVVKSCLSLRHWFLSFTRLGNQTITIILLRSNLSYWNLGMKTCCPEQVWFLCSRNFTSETSPRLKFWWSTPAKFILDFVFFPVAGTERWRKLLNSPFQTPLAPVNQCACYLSVNRLFFSRVFLLFWLAVNELTKNWGPGLLFLIVHFTWFVEIYHAEDQSASVIKVNSHIRL